MEKKKNLLLRPRKEEDLKKQTQSKNYQVRNLRRGSTNQENLSTVNRKVILRKVTHHLIDNTQVLIQSK